MSLRRAVTDGVLGGGRRESLRHRSQRRIGSAKVLRSRHRRTSAAPTAARKFQPPRERPSPGLANLIRFIYYSRQRNRCRFSPVHKVLRPRTNENATGRTASSSLQTATRSALRTRYFCRSCSIFRALPARPPRPNSGSLAHAVTHPAPGGTESQYCAGA